MTSHNKLISLSFEILPNQCVNLITHFVSHSRTPNCCFFQFRGSILWHFSLPNPSLFNDTCLHQSLLFLSSECHLQVPTYGTALEEHLRRTDREIATVLDDCIAMIMSLGLEEEGLFRIAGSASKVKKLKASFDAGYVDMNDYVYDIHCVAGESQQCYLFVCLLSLFISFTYLFV